MLWLKGSLLNRVSADLGDCSTFGKHVPLNLFDLNSLLVFLLLVICGIEIVYCDCLAELSIDVFQRSVTSLREEEVDDREVERRRTDEHEEELPADVVQGDGTSDNNDDLCGELVEHADSSSLSSDFGREDFAHIEVLSCVEARAPEEDEEVDEEDGRLLPSLICATSVHSLKSTFADK